jgi:hypothetical protein
VSPGVVKMLIEAKARVNAVDSQGNTPLLTLFKHTRWDWDKIGICQSLQVLLDAGADPTLHDYYEGETVLMWVVRSPCIFGECGFFGVPAIISEVVSAVLHRPATG